MKVPSRDTPEQADSPMGQPRLVRMSDIQPEAVQWLWPGRFAIGKLSLLVGDPGMAKSLIIADVAARVSAGMPWPDSEQVQEPGDVILLSAEDDPADTIRPRLDAAGADVSRIVLLKEIGWYNPDAKQETTKPFTLSDVESLERALDEVPGCRLVVVDPVSAYCGTTDTHNNAEVRQLLAPLAELAQRRRVAVVAVTHLNKGSGPAIYRATGSLGFIAAARAAWAVVKDPADPAWRLFLPIKCNLAPDVAGLSYHVADAGGVPRIAWGEVVATTVDEVLAAGFPRSYGRSAKQDGTAWLRDFLACGPRLSQEIQDAADAAGFSWATIRRAQKDLEIVPQKKQGVNGRWMWALPNPTNEERCSRSSCPASEQDWHLHPSEGVDTEPLEKPDDLEEATWTA